MSLRLSSEARPLVRILGHGAERSGPPIYLARLLRWWQQHPPGFDVEIVVGRAGPLVAGYQRTAPTSVTRLDRRSPELIAERVLVAAGAPRRRAARLTDVAIRHRARARRSPAVTVVNGATAPTARLLMALDPPGEVVLIAHELSTGWFHNIDADARARLLEADRFLAVSRCVERFLIEDLGVAPDRISSAPPMVEAVESHVPAHSDEATGPFVVAGGGMTDWRKAPELWLNVAFQVRRAAPDLRVSWVWFGGDPPSSREFWPIAHEIEHLGLAAQVAFLGDVSDTASVLSSCDLFLSTAREDAYPLVCAEAAMSGVPVIAFDGGGAAELVDDGRCGRTVSYPDLGRMAAEVVDLLRHPQRRRELGESGRAFARSHLDVSVVGPAISEWILPQAAP